MLKIIRNSILKIKHNRNESYLYPLFDVDWYLTAYPDVARSGVNPLVHYLKNGWREGRNPNGLFDVRWYLEAYPDVSKEGVEPLEHFVKYGWREARNPNPIFDTRWYLEAYPDLASAGVNPLEHYLKYGWREGRKPSVIFDAQWYLDHNPDILNAGLNPLEHYLRYGWKEGRRYNRYGIDDKFISDRLEKLASPGSFSNLKNCKKLTHLELSDNPTVSVIIPVYGKFDYTYRCLESIARCNPSCSYEIIVVDDCSSDDSFAKLQEIEGIRLLRNEVNSGFIDTCNFGAANAKGSYLYFLNNDTEILNGTIDELVSTFENNADVGLVGSKLLYPDGTLQEAGGIIWKDGSGWNYGRYKDRNRPEYEYMRSVDYCSGASIMIKKSLFDELGHFDTRYRPAYYEDADLGFKVRQKGLCVLYQPKSVVIHYEGISSGTSTSEGIKKYQIDNQAKFAEYWALELEVYAKNGTDPELNKDRDCQQRALIIDVCTPTWDKDAGSQQVTSLMMLLKMCGVQVTFIASDNYLVIEKYTDSLQRAGVEVLYKPYVDSVESHILPYGSRYDLSFLYRPQVSTSFLSSVEKYCPQSRIIYHTVDLHFLREERQASVTGSSKLLSQSTKTFWIEKKTIERVDCALIHSDVEMEELAKRGVGGVQALHPLVYAESISRIEFSNRSGLMFVGGFNHAPNGDAANYLLTEIMPLVWRAYPEMIVYIVGSNPPKSISDYADERIKVLGYVENLDEYYDKVRVSIAPLRYGAGVKGKIGSAMIKGIPVVTTAIGAEGMNLDNGKNILIASDTHEFAELIINAYGNPDLWKMIRNNAYDYAQNTWGIQSAFNIMQEILAKVSFDLNKKRSSFMGLS
jgi:GT2 family glycosyltransferase/glycosyltransferase involved in cell wall biosynthesis